MSHTPFSHMVDLDQLDAKKYIIIKGAHLHNLKNLNIAIPRNQLVVVTGVSGSGKSSLVFDTLFSEAQRMYLESLTTYVRQFFGKMERTHVESVRGISPAIAIEQRTNVKNPRSTVGTMTEIYDYMKLLYARIGATYSPISGSKVMQSNVSDVVDYINTHPPGTRVVILYDKKIKEEGGLLNTLKKVREEGFTKIMQANQLIPIEEILLNNNFFFLENQEQITILVDRVIVNKERKDYQFRIADSIQTAFLAGKGSCIVHIIGIGVKIFSNRFECDGISFEPPSVSLFSFNNSYGACKTCNGLGQVIGIDKNKVIPNKQLSIFEGAIMPWRSVTMQKWLMPLISNSSDFNFPIHQPFYKLSREHQDLLWRGNEYFQGLNNFFEYLATKTYKIQYRVLLSRYRDKKVCEDCQGTRIKKEASYVRVGGRTIPELLLLPIKDLIIFFQNLSLTSYEEQVAEYILLEIKNRLSYLMKVGLEYLTLHRAATTLSGGESQRIKLATSLGSPLVHAMYILDEPTIGLHPRDTYKLIDILLSLRDMNNTVIVVEHEERVMRAADHVIEIGPDAGLGGGQLVFQGDWATLKSFGDSHTTKYLNGIVKIDLPSRRRPWHYALEVQNASVNNLQNITVKIPLEILTVITGVSGSGKTTLVKEIIYPNVQEMVSSNKSIPSGINYISGDMHKINCIEWIDQNPIGKSSRSNPVTYIKAYDSIRKLFAEQPLAKQRGYTMGYFSFNLSIGSCETCQGEGKQKIEMQFMADIILTCEECAGSRFKKTVLEVTYKGKNIAEVLAMTVTESLSFFKRNNDIYDKISSLKKVGLGYIQLGQSASSLSGGEAQRVKLASYLQKGTHAQNTLFIFDEPTTGLHMHDINQLMWALNALIEQGNSIIIIEHNMDVVKCADWIIDLGPSGGDQGGKVVFSGTPEDMIHLSNNHTALFLKEKILLT